MKKIGIINGPISAVIASLGHTDTVVIADAGLPIPTGPERIDLALSAGLPAFLDTLRVVLTEMQVERAVIASEMLEVSPTVYQAIKALLGETPIDTLPHESFKQQTRSARAVIRTGEFTPYANIILVAGVVF
jgi:D-ribose pyranase